MFSYYQPFLFPFLKFQPNVPPSGLKQLYYHSFEDGLWDILDKKYPNSKVTFLVPDFYCSDVLDNIRSRGHKYIYYPLDANFQISSSAFGKYIWLFRPDLVIIFNAAGIPSGLLKDTSWLRHLPDNSIILEDSVHQLVDPQQIKILNKRHIVMDSLRKVSPLPGSRMFGAEEFLDFTAPPPVILSGYLYGSFFLYLAFRIGLVLGHLTDSPRLVAWSHNYLLKKHDDLIGDSRKAFSGLAFFRFIIRRLNYGKVANIKASQVKTYKKLLAASYRKKYLSKVKIPDPGLLHVYPLVFPYAPPGKLIKMLEDSGLPVWFKFTDMPWSRNRSVLFLPLGFHVSESSIKHLTGLVNVYLGHAGRRS